VSHRSVLGATAIFILLVFVIPQHPPGASSQCCAPVEGYLTSAQAGQAKDPVVGGFHPQSALEPVAATTTWRVFTSSLAGPAAQRTASFRPWAGALSAITTASPGAGAIPLTVSFQVDATGGAPPYTFVWSFGDGSPNFRSNSTGNVSHTYVSAGVYFATSWTNDSVNGSANSTLRIVAEAQQLRVSNVTATPARIELSQSVRFTAVASGGTGVYNWTWYGLPPGCASSNVSSIACIPTSVVNTSIYVVLRDSAYVSTVSSDLAFDVSGRLRVGPLNGTQPRIEVGQKLALSTTVTGGLTPYKYTWNGMPSGCTSVNLSALNCSPASSGNYQIMLTVSDSGSVEVSAYRNITISPRLSVVGPVLKSPVIDVGQSFIASVTVTGGFGQYNYTWLGPPPGCSPTNDFTITCSPTVAGSYAISVAVDDGSGVMVTSSSFALIVNPALRVRASAEPVALSVGGVVNISVSVNGGTSPFRVSLTGLPAGCSVPTTGNYTCQVGAAGSYVVGVLVTDGAGVSKRAVLYFNATASNSGQNLTSALVIAGAVVVSGAVAAAALVYIRRRKAPER
jgi:large repetitive protein